MPTYEASEEVMETIGFIHAAINHEDPNPTPELRSLDVNLPNSALMTAAGIAVTATVLSTGSDRAMAATPVQGAGSSGAKVQAVQKALGIQADGQYGSKTEAAVTDFQIRQGLKQIDGVVGKETATALGLDEKYRPVGYVSTPSRIGVNIRSGPGLGYARVGGAGDGAYLSQDYSNTVNRDGYTWTRVPGRGWVAADYTYGGNDNGGSERPVSFPGGGSGGYVSTNSGIGVNIRSGPGLGYGRIDGASDNSYVGTSGGTVEADGYIWQRAEGGGWVATNYLD